MAKTQLTGNQIKDTDITVSDIADGAVSLAKMADLDNNKVIGRVAGTTGVPEAVDISTIAGFIVLSGYMEKSIYDADLDNLVDDSLSTQSIQGRAVDPSLSPNDGEILRWNTSLNRYVSDVQMSGTVTFFEEDLTNLVDGSATHFDTAADFVGGSLVVVDNGLEQNSPEVVEDFDLSGFTLDYVVPSGHQLFARYVLNSSTAVITSLARPSLLVQELDGSPSVATVSSIKVPNSLLINNGDNSVTIRPDTLGIMYYWSLLTGNA